VAGIPLLSTPDGVVKGRSEIDAVSAHR